MTDVVIVGAGPSGLAAAAVCGQHGLATTLLDDQPAPGGQIWRAADAIGTDPLPALAKTYEGARAAIEAARKCVTLCPSAHVLDVTSDRTVLWLDRATATPRLTETPANALVLATGAAERPVAFPGWTLPGVMGAGALQVALKQGGLVPEGPIVLAGQGPLLLLILDQLTSAGAHVVAVLDFAVGGRAKAVKPLLDAAFADRALVREGARLLLRRKRSGVPVVRGVKALRAVGEAALAAVEVEDGAGRHHRFEATTLAVHDGVIANTQLSRLMNLPHRWRTADAAFVPDVDPTFRAADRVWVVGDGAGIGGAALA
ncbi:MAG: FAD-dependent oxidoreductase, partial [Pseudomonadota bacterium]